MFPRRPDVLCQRRHFFTLNRFLWNLGHIITTANRQTDYILDKIVPGTREQDMTENSNWCQIGAAMQHWLTHFTVSQHAVSAGLASPLHTCSGRGIIWPSTVFSSLVLNIKKLQNCILWAYMCTTSFYVRFLSNKFIIIIMINALLCNDHSCILL